jgi:hypothetical protein
MPVTHKTNSSVQNVPKIMQSERPNSLVEYSSTIIALMMETVSTCETPNVVVEWPTILLRVREVPGSNLGPETGYPDLWFSWVSPVPPRKWLKSGLP